MNRLGARGYEAFVEHDIRPFKHTVNIAAKAPMLYVMPKLFAFSRSPCSTELAKTADAATGTPALPACFASLASVIVFGPFKGCWYLNPKV